MGEGGLDKRNAIQLLHTVFSMYEVVKVRRNKLVTQLWIKLNPDDITYETLPNELLRTLQEPLITRWWTIPKIAAFVKRNLKFVSMMAHAIHNDAKSGTKEHTIALNTISLLSEPWIVADVGFLLVLSGMFVNRFMRFYQRSDPNVGTPGHVGHHWLVAYFLMVQTLEEIKSSWEVLPDFSKAKKLTDEIQDEENQNLKREGYKRLVSKMILQVCKHNTHYLTSTHLVRSMFAEKPIGTVVAKILDAGIFCS